MHNQHRHIFFDFILIRIIRISSPQLEGRAGFGKYEFSLSLIKGRVGIHGRGGFCLSTQIILPILGGQQARIAAYPAWK